MSLPFLLISRRKEVKMRKKDRERLAEEWKEILESHPTLARTFLAQHAILMGGSELGYALADRSMCKLLESGLPVLFEDFWVSRCEPRVRGEFEIGGIIGSFSDTNRGPARCFGSDDPEGWFDGPLAGGRILPPKPAKCSLLISSKNNHSSNLQFTQK
jgi:hypothetical protein